MPVSVDCPDCGTRFNVADGFLGKQIKCNVCGGPVPVGFTAAPKRRRQRRRSSGIPAVLILVLVLGGLALGVCVLGIVGVAVWSRKPATGAPGLMPDLLAGSEVLTGPDLDPAKWPPMPAFDGHFGPDLTVTLYVSGVTPSNSKAISERLSELVDKDLGGQSFGSTGNGTDRMLARLAPVRDVNAFAKRIDFGRVTYVRDRTVVIVANKDVPMPLKKK